MTALKLNTDRLCWYTRGLLWDYTILCYPSAPSRKGWLTPLEKIFGGDEPQAQPRYIAGTIHWESASNPTQSEFVAVVFLDEARTDRDGRSIKHYLLYLLDDETRNEFRIGWHSALLSSLASSYEDIFPLSPEDLSRTAESTTLFDIRELTERFHRTLSEEIEIKVSEDSEECPWLLLSIHMAPPPMQENANKRRNAILGGAVTVGVSALLASLWPRWEKNSQPSGVDAHTSIEVSVDASKDSEAHPTRPKGSAAAPSVELRHPLNFVSHRELSATVGSQSMCSSTEHKGLFDESQNDLSTWIFRLHPNEGSTQCVDAPQLPHNDYPADMLNDLLKGRSH